MKNIIRTENEKLTGFSALNKLFNEKIVASNIRREANLTGKKKFLNICDYLIKNNYPKTTFVYKQTPSYQDILIELADFISEQVAVKSILINNKEQNPQTNISVDLKDTWSTLKINP